MMNELTTEKVVELGHKIYKEVLDAAQKEIEQKPVEAKPHLPNGSIRYDRGFEEAQDYISERGFDVPWNDCDVFVDERYITQTVANVLTWADEHPKQTPVEWSEEDEKMLDDCDTAICSSTSFFKSSKDKMRNWLKSLKNRCQPQSKQEWSEEDESYLVTIIHELQNSQNEAKSYEHKTYNKLIDWLNSLRPQPKQE